jgi:hypothetical protein
VQGEPTPVPATNQLGRAKALLCFRRLVGALPGAGGAKSQSRLDRELLYGAVVLDGGRAQMAPCERQIP